MTILALSYLAAGLGYYAWIHRVAPVVDERILGWTPPKRDEAEVVYLFPEVERRTEQRRQTERRETLHIESAQNRGPDRRQSHKEAA